MGITNLISKCAGKLAQVPIPGAARAAIIGGFAKAVGANLSESLVSPAQCQNLLEFFIRELKPGLRPIKGEFVSPVDGTLRGVEAISSDSLIQAKGIKYTVTDLLCDSSCASRFIGGTAYNLYLAPCDYHHVHSPVSGKIISSRHISGSLWPVNGLSVNNINNLFVKNERVVTYIECSLGLVALVMVGALNVGKVTVVYDNIISNSCSSAAGARKYDPPHDIQIGAKLGTFYLGSTVVLLVNKRMESDSLKANTKIKMGEKLSSD